MNFKSFLTILITGVIVGGGVYFWQNQSHNMQQFSQEVCMPVQTGDIIETAKISGGDFLYLVSSSSSKDTTAVLRDSLLSFSLKYLYNEWGSLYFLKTDLTASDGAVDPNYFDGFAIYDFCAGSSFCDMAKEDGQGFQLKVWNANYSGRDKNPNFYTKDGETLVIETDNIIVTYKPYKGWDVAVAVAKLFKSFELLK